MYAYRYQLTRGESSGLKTISYKTEAARDKRAETYANLDNEAVMVFDYVRQDGDQHHRWWMTRMVKPNPATRALVAYDEWKAERAELNERENVLSTSPDYDPVDADEWHASDDSGIELLDALADALAASEDKRLAMRDGVLHLWNHQGGWIPGAAHSGLAAILGLPNSATLEASEKRRK